MNGWLINCFFSSFQDNGSYSFRYPETNINGRCHTCHTSTTHQQPRQTDNKKISVYPCVSEANPWFIKCKVSVLCEFSYLFFIIRDRSSARVSERVSKIPRTAEVTVRAPGLRIPLMVMHICSASITTITP